MFAPQIAPLITPILQIFFPKKLLNKKTVFLYLHFFLIREVPNDFFVDIVSSNNFLATILNQLFGFVRNNETVDLALRNRMEKFQVTQSL